MSRETKAIKPPSINKSEGAGPSSNERPANVPAHILQANVESITKHKVFLDSNPAINKLGKDLLKLRNLLTHTQKIIEDVKINRLPESRAKLLRSNTMQPVKISEFMQMKQAMADMNDLSTNEARYLKPSEGSTNIPSWILSAPNDINNGAVELIMRVRQVLPTIRGAGDANASSRLDQILKSVDAQSHQLAKILRKSLDSLPPSNLWGSGEKKKRMKLIIQLGEAKLAADGFAGNKVDIIRRIYRSVEGSGDNLLYISKLTNKFFNFILEQSVMFLELFREYNNDAMIMAHLLDWSAIQISSFIDVISRQIVLGVNERNTVTLLQLRSSTSVGTTVNNTKKATSQNASPAKDASTGAVLSKGKYNYADDVAASDDLLNSDSAGKFSFEASSVRKTKVVTILPKTTVSKGSLSLVSSCLDIIFKEQLDKLFGKTTTAHLTSMRTMETVEPVDRLGLQGFTVVEYLLLPEVSKFISALGEEIIKEVSAQVHQDSWDGVKPFTLQFSGFEGYLHDNSYHKDVDAIGVGLCYQLLISSLNFFLDEIKTLLRLDNESVNKDGYKYSRADVCEAESASAICLMRIVLVFVMELEDVELTTLNSQQISTFQLTLKVTEVFMIPSLQSVFDFYGFSILTTKTQSYQSSSEIPQLLLQRVRQLLTTIDSYKNQHE